MPIQPHDPEHGQQPEHEPQQQPPPYFYGPQQPPSTPYGFGPPQPPPPAGNSHGLRWALIGAAAVVVLAGAGVGAYYGVNGGFGTQPADASTTVHHRHHAPKPPPKPQVTTLTIDFTLYDKATAANGCVGTPGYDDISEGAVVTTTSQNGTIIGSASLGKGVATNSEQCDWIIKIHDVPTTATQYSTNVARRGAVTVSKAELEQNYWETGIQLGTKGD